MGETGIPYADKAVNCIIGCPDTGQPCLPRCWARELHDMRHKAYMEGKNLPDQYAKPFSELQILPERIEEALHWRKPQTIVWNFMADTFHEQVPFEVIDQMMAVVALTPQHTHLMLTKRPQVALEYVQQEPRGQIDHAITKGMACYIGRGKAWAGKGLTTHLAHRTSLWPLPNLYLGITCCTQADFDRMLPIHGQIPGRKWLSLEPLLGEINLERFLTYSNVGVESGYEDTKQSSTGGRKTHQSSSRRRTSNRQSRENLEDSQTRMGQVAKENGPSEMQEGPGRTQSSRLSNNSSNVEQEVGLRSGQPLSMEIFQGANTARSNNQSQGREQKEQPPEQLGNSNLLGAGASCEARSGQVRRKGREEPLIQIDKSQGKTNTESKTKRSETSSISGEIRNINPDNIKSRSRPHMDACTLSLVVCGCEKHNGKPGRFCQDEARWWQAARDIKEQCQAAGVPIWIKQGPRNGKVITRLEDLPEDMRVQKRPK